jgi:hypothetical protein
VSTMSLEFVSTMSLEFFVNYVLDWFTGSLVAIVMAEGLRLNWRDKRRYWGGFSASLGCGAGHLVE